jgi:hypothetical protein
MHSIALWIWKGKDKHRLILYKLKVVFTINIKISFYQVFYVVEDGGIGA